MNIGAKTTNGLLFSNFNQDSSCLSVGTRTGYKIYNCDPFGKCYGKKDGGIGIIEMLFCTSLVALVGAGEHPAFSPRRLQIINTKRQSTICELTFTSNILVVKLNRRRLVVALQEQIHIYDISNMKLLHSIDTSPNPNENCFLAYPSNATTTSGEILVFDAVELRAVTIIQAHKSPLSCMTFNCDGTMVATTSDKGTVIRVFAVPGGQKLFQFRRGTYSAHIYSIAFSIDSQLLAVSSATDTVHIYKLENTMEASMQSVEQPKKASGIMGSLRSPLSAAGAMLPDMLTEIWEPTRDFAHAKLPGHAGQNLCAVSNVNGTLHLYVVTASAFLLYSIPPTGGDCNLLQTESLMDLEED